MPQPQTVWSTPTKPFRPAVLACVLCLGAGTLTAAGARAHARVPGAWLAPAMGSFSASLEQCVPAAAASERSATFTGEMVATLGTQRMGMKIELLEHVHGEPGFHTVVSPGVGVWRGSEPGVRIYRYVKQITNLSAPAAYRAVVRFRWLGDEGRVIKRAELRTARCAQPLLAPPPPPPSPPPSGEPAA